MGIQCGHIPSGFPSKAFYDFILIVGANVPDILLPWFFHLSISIWISEELSLRNNRSTISLSGIFPQSHSLANRINILNKRYDGRYFESYSPFPYVLL
jgi:hypothetical protein